jgi:hypothetical protein
VYNPIIEKYLSEAKRTQFCECKDGCQKTAECPCYRWNKDMIYPTYQKRFSKRTGKFIAVQSRAQESSEKIYSFNECHPSCQCNKKQC